MAIDHLAVDEGFIEDVCSSNEVPRLKNAHLCENSKWFFVNGIILVNI